MELLKGAEIPTYALALTAERAAKKGWALPDSLFTGETLVRLGERSIDLYHPGAWHAPDNITVWLVEAIGRITSRYVDAWIIVPGHGDVGDRSMLLHTLELLH